MQLRLEASPCSRLTRIYQSDYDSSESSVHIAIPKYADTPRPKLVNEGPRVQGGPINGCIVENSSFDASLGGVLMRV